MLNAGLCPALVSSVMSCESLFLRLYLGLLHIHGDKGTKKNCNNLYFITKNNCSLLQIIKKGSIRISENSDAALLYSYELNVVISSAVHSCVPVLLAFSAVPSAAVALPEGVLPFQIASSDSSCSLHGEPRGWRGVSHRQLSCEVPTLSGLRRRVIQSSRS